MGQLAHFRNYAALPMCDLVALAEPREATAAVVAERYGIMNVYRDVGETLDHEELDGVVATLCSIGHKDVLPLIYGHVLDVFTEKSPADSSASGRDWQQRRRIRERTHDRYDKRCDPAVVEAHSLIREWRESRRHGDLRYVRITVATVIGSPALTSTISTEASQSRPSPSPTPTRAASTSTSSTSTSTRSTLLRHLLGEDYSVTFADAAGLVMGAQSDSGVTCVLELRPFDVVDRWYETALVAFERATVTLSLPAPLASAAGSVDVRTDDGRYVRQRLRVAPRPAMLEQARAFAQVCAGESEPPCDVAEALRDLETADDYVSVRFGAGPRARA